MPEITVIIPTYNMERYIIRALDSVLNQDFTNFEILVIDDASTDNTYSLLEQIYQNEDRLHIIKHECNKGLGWARNTGITYARGRYLFFLDSDDWIEKNTLSKLYAVATSENAEIIACGVRLVYEDGRLETYHAVDMKTSGNVTGLTKMLEGKISVTAWNKLYKKSFIDEHQIRFPPILHEDINFAIEAIYHCKSFISIPAELYNYYQSAQSITRGKFSSKHIYSYIEIFKLINEFLKEVTFENPEDKEEFIQKLIQFQARWMIFNLKNLYKQTDREETNKIVSEAFSSQFGSAFYFPQSVLDCLIRENLHLSANYPLQLLNKIKDKKVILFGAGSASINILNVFPLAVSYCIDNNRAKWNQKFQDLPIFNPAILLEEEKESIAIIVSSQYYKEISKQLREMGFAENIHFWDGYLIFRDFFHIVHI